MLIMVKPDGTERRLVGTIITLAEHAGFKLLRAKRLRLSESRAKMLYKEHWLKSWFQDNINYITSGDVVALEFDGKRDDKLVASIRSTYGLDFRRNTIHCSEHEDAEYRERLILFL